MEVYVCYEVNYCVNNADIGMVSDMRVFCTEKDAEMWMRSRIKLGNEEGFTEDGTDQLLVKGEVSSEELHKEIESGHAELLMEDGTHDYGICISKKEVDFFSYPITPGRMMTLLDSMINYLSELVHNPEDLRGTLNCIGLSDEEIGMLVDESLLGD